MIYYNPATGGFLDTVIHGTDLPEGIVEVSSERRGQIIAARADGQVIACSGGVISFQAAPPAPAAVVEEQERIWRDGVMLRAAGLRDRHRDQQELGLPTTLKPDQFMSLLLYIQQLRDWPQAELFPGIEHRPVPPTWLADLTP